MTRVDGPAAAIGALVVLTDSGCPLCVHLARWLDRQPQLVPLELVDAASPQARARFPELDPGMTLRDLTVVADTGAWWHGGPAWVMCLWALADYRTRALRLSGPAGQAAARAMARTAALVHARTTATSVATPPEGLDYGDCRDGTCR